ncbi:MAG: hypothetical protein Q8O13_10660 [Candidatus Omnitrophota bacterium]|nr:hypothetical protein [Candidatus Omnitrophota bacterium]
MKEIIKILITLLLGGAGFIILKFILDPILKQKSHITTVIDYLISNANIIATPGKDNIEKRNNISRELRNLSSGLTSKTLAIPVYTIFEIPKIVKKKSEIEKTAQDLMRLSNSLFEGYQDINLSNSQTLKRIYKRLGIKTN